jgi:hypothetical protein
VREPTIIIRFDGNERIYAPGEALSGEYRLQAMQGFRINSIEVSVLWYTEGKGDEDFGVHQFWRFGADRGDPTDPSRPGRFQTTLPQSPLSYEGQIINVRWCVRVRAFLHRKKEIMREKIFCLGNVPSMKATT